MVEPVLQCAQGSVDQKPCIAPRPVEVLVCFRLRLVPGTGVMEVIRSVLTGEIKARRQLGNVGEAGWNLVEVAPDIPTLSLRHLRVANGTPECPRQRQDAVLRQAIAEPSPRAWTPAPSLRVWWNVRLHVDRKRVA